ncbi:TPA: transcriptional regulator, partial [Salmonella enterica]|nr:transcriptional regulator [Salmonella enterica subsp. enterica serovar Newport str. CFSAN000599]EDU1197095.1 transcriptional regulator [Salmonella enterica subsp. enterica serovar Heidelberg str. CFSAN000576]HAF8581236.1 transcriptional regulator [Salmonella enterica]ECU9164238.1 transcriptional regulator [Salmonella enterica subsp. enterica serovar Newport str. CFSAN000599]EDU1197108.1 transcriptional regulator [Salmonella enterica subsp. enterica serovar Heidelberg str. CFSAN000576]
RGHLYWHVCRELTGELATFDGDSRIAGGQVIQLKELVIKYQIPRVLVEVNGPGSFAGKLLRQALKGTGCGVTEIFNTVNKQKRILDAFEAPLSARFLWAHTDVLDGPMFEQMRDFNPALTDQPDDYIDSGAGAVTATPVRIGKMVRNPDTVTRENWRPTDGVYEVEADY